RALPGAAAAAAGLAGRVQPPASARRQPAPRHVVVGEPRDEARPRAPRRLDGGRAVSRLADSLHAGRFVVTAEMPTIDGGGLDEVRRQLDPMRDYLDAVNATDNTAAHAHASPLAVAIALRDEGVDPVMQLVCRDRNRLALEADIL